MGCLGECWEMGPPPDSILSLPPPPLPAFLQPPVPDLLLNTTPCSSTQLCESLPSLNKVPDGGDYVEMSRKDIETTWSVTTIDDTWLLVLVASSIGVLLLGALLAMFLLKCREMNMFESNECSMHSRDHRQIKNHEPRECTSVSNLNGSKLVHPTETVMYHGSGTGGGGVPDNRMVWAALTPHGTQHFVSENYPRDLIDYGDGDDHYETVDNLNIQPVLSHPPYNPYKGLTLRLVREKSSFDNSGFVDYDYEDPTPLIESYQLSDMENRDGQFQVLGNTDMRCASLGFAGNTLRRGVVPVRPRVSSPTRIEHPNLPPLNLYPHKANTLKRNTLGYRNVDTGTLPKYGC